MDSWEEVSLGDVIELKRGYDLPQQCRKSGNVPIVSSSGITDYHAESMVKGPGVVTGRYGTLGQVFYVDEEFWPLNTTLYVRDFKGNDPRFISYFLRSIDFQPFSDKAAVPGLNRNHLHMARVRFPRNVDEQKAIGKILASLDAKIELNKKMSKTLEATAASIFKAWFIDFEPLTAKNAGLWHKGQSLPGLPERVYSMFPERLVHSELGEIPEGWSLGTVDSEFQLTMGQSPPGDTYNETGIGLPFYQGRADFSFRHPTRRVYCTAPTRFAQRGDTLVSVRAPVGDVNMATENCAIGRGVAAIRHKSGSRSFTYYAMKALEPVFASFEAEGTVFGSISKKDFHRLMIVIPPEELLLEFERLCEPMDSLIECQQRECETLVSIRDAILPKLVSGEIRLRDIKRLTTV